MSGDAGGTDANSLEDALEVVRVAKAKMGNCLDGHRLMDGLKHASTMLAEMKTSALGPKQYYELYMSVFDALGYLSSYLVEAHRAERHHLADLYELVQYAGSIVPRLYLMITVGTAYMSMPDAPIREIMRDMMEMSRGVQHPIRGLFLRYYLSGKCRDHMPIGEADSPSGNLEDSVQFTLTNFIEMNKLWVRLQHQGHSRERHLRELERSELKTLVGTNLVRLSQLDGVGLDAYSETLLPAILEQVVQCRDVLAQEYLLEVVTQVFPDEWHLHTLDRLLSTIAKLNPHTNVKQIVIEVIDRLSQYAAAQVDNDDPAERAREESEAKALLEARLKRLRIGSTDGEGDTPGKDESAEVSEPADDDKKKTYRGIPTDIRLFDIFWDQVTVIVGARSDLKIQDISAMLVSLCNLSLRCYPAEVDQIDRIYAFARERTEEQRDSTDLHSPQAKDNLLKLLLAPVEAYPSLLTILAIPSYLDLLHAQSYSIRRAVAAAVADSLIANQTKLDNAADVEGVFSLLHVIVASPDGEADAAGTGSAAATANSGNAGPRWTSRSAADADSEDLVEEQGWLARIIHQIKADSDTTQLELLQITRRELAAGMDRIRYTYPALLSSTLLLARRSARPGAEAADAAEPGAGGRGRAVFRFLHQTIAQLQARSGQAEPVLQQYLAAAQVSDGCGLEEVAYEFFAEAFTVYEESVSESRAQYRAVATLCAALQQTRCFSRDNYDTLITKCALHGAKLLKKPDQVRAILLASHLWWQTELPGEDEEEEDEEGAGSGEAGKAFRDGRRVLECLQKALKIADACMDATTSVELFVEILDRYVYYYDQQADEITPKFINGLLDLIRQNLDGLEPSSAGSATVGGGAAAGGGGGDGEPSTADGIRAYFQRTLDHIRRRREDEDGEHWQPVEVQ